MEFAGNEKASLRFFANITTLLFCAGLLVFASRCSKNSDEEPINAEKLNKDYYPQILNAVDGEEVIIKGFVDGKILCWDHTTKPDPDSCEIALFRRCPFAYVPFRIKYCSASTTSNCIFRLPTTDDYYKSDIRGIFRDDSGQTFDPGAEISVNVVVGTNQAGGKFVKSLKHINVIPGSFDPVNGCESTTSSPN